MFYAFDELKDKPELLPRVGKKALSLIEMSRWNLPVPSGAVVSTDALETFLALNQIDELIEASMGTLSSHSPCARICAEAIQKRIIQGVIPEELLKAIDQFLLAHPGARFAVRSSGSYEDLPGASFAGLYNSILNVTGREALVDAIRNCWASLYNDRVIKYCLQKNIDLRLMKLAVVVQQMIPAEKSGVIFTVNPLTGLDKEMVIEACFGLGEALVGGEVTPDQYRYNWFDQQEIERIISNKKISIVPCDEPPFTLKIENSAQDAQRAVLSTEEIRRLSDLAVLIQAEYGFPVDIEWVYCQGQFFIVQSRPITKVNYSGIQGEWTTADFKDGGVSSTVCSPFMWSLYDFIWEITMPAYLRKVHLESDHMDDLWGDMFFGRPYWNLQAVKGGLIKKLPGFNERQFDEALGIQVSYPGDGHVTGISLKTLLSGIRILLALGRSFAHQKKFCPQFTKAQQKKLEDIDRLDPESMGREEFLAFYENFIKEEYFLSEASYFYHIFDNSNVTSLFKDFIKKLPVSVNYLSLISGLTGISHMKPVYRLWDISRIIQSNPDSLGYWQSASVAQLRDACTAGSDLHCMREIREYIAEYKFHSTRELDITVPRYGEDPSFVFESVKNYLELDDDHDPRKHTERQKQEFDAEKERITSSLSFFKAKSFERKLDQWRWFLWWREELRDLSTQFYYQVRRFTLVAAKHLCQMGYLTDENEIFFLPVNDIYRVIHRQITPEQTQQLVQRNLLYYRSFRNFKNPNEIGRHFVDKTQAQIKQTDLLKGIPCSPGVVTGTCRVIRDIFDSERLQKGDILVTVYTDPGWTPKFSLLSGVITETGGLLSHAAVIAREYGFPAVLAVDHATQHIQDGQRVTIDGNMGTIILESAAAEPTEVELQLDQESCTVPGEIAKTSSACQQ